MPSGGGPIYFSLISKNVEPMADKQVVDKTGLNNISIRFIRILLTTWAHTKTRPRVCCRVASAIKRALLAMCHVLLLNVFKLNPVNA